MIEMGLGEITMIPKYNIINHAKTLNIGFLESIGGKFVKMLVSIWASAKCEYEGHK